MEEKDNIQKNITSSIFYTPEVSLLLEIKLVRILIDHKTGKKRNLWIFLSALEYSKDINLYISWKYDTKTIIQALEYMFQTIGGVPKQIIINNSKKFVIESSYYEDMFNPIMKKFSDHYGFTIDACSSQDIFNKWKLKFLIIFIKKICISCNNFASIEQFQQYLNRILSIQNYAMNDTISRESFNYFTRNEILNLKNLPKITYTIDEFSVKNGRQDGFVKFFGRYYSIGNDYFRKKIFIIANESQVYFYHQGKLIETHNRINNLPKYISTKEYHLKSWEKISDDYQFYIEKAKEIGLNCEIIISIILSLGNGFIDTRMIWGILNLEKKYRKINIDYACEKAIKIKRYSYRAVLNYTINSECKRKKSYGSKKNTIIIH